MIPRFKKFAVAALTILAGLILSSTSIMVKAAVGDLDTSFIPG